MFHVKKYLEIDEDGFYSRTITNETFQTSHIEKIEPTSLHSQIEHVMGPSDPHIAYPD